MANGLLLFYIIGVILNLWIFTDAKVWTKDAFLPQIFVALTSFAVTLWALHYKPKTQ